MADGDNRLTLRQSTSDISLHDVLSYSDDPSSVSYPYGTCKLSDIMIPSDRLDFQSSVYPKSRENYTSDCSVLSSLTEEQGYIERSSNLAGRDCSDQIKHTEENQEEVGGAEEGHIDLIKPNSTHISIRAESDTLRPQSPVSVFVIAPGITLNDVREKTLDPTVDINEGARECLK